jgi:hypothetical protein
MTPVHSQERPDVNSPGVKGGDGRIFGLPLGNFGLFASLLIALCSGFLAFFLVTFLSIFGILFYNTIGHHSVDFAIAYKVIALPVGAGVLVVALFLLGFLWVRRKLAGS